MAKIINLALASLFSIVVVGLAASAIYFWWFGVIDGFNHITGFPYPFGFAIFVVGFLFAPRTTSLISAIIGAWCTFFIWDWPWYFSALLYATSVSVFFTKAIFNVALQIAAVVIINFDKFLKVKRK